jgi:hypothetical protein
LCSRASVRGSMLVVMGWGVGRALVAPCGATRLVGAVFLVAMSTTIHHKSQFARSSLGGGMECGY